jgi:hypothetical protein
MAVLSQTDGQQKLSRWNMSDPLRVTPSKNPRFSLGLPFGFRASMKMDDQFIAVSTCYYESTGINFFSKKLLDLHWQKTFDKNVMHFISQKSFQVERPLRSEVLNQSCFP